MLLLLRHRWLLRHTLVGRWRRHLGRYKRYPWVSRTSWGAIRVIRVPVLCIRIWLLLLLLLLLRIWGWLSLLSLLIGIGIKGRPLLRLRRPLIQIWVWLLLLLLLCRIPLGGRSLWLWRLLLWLRWLRLMGRLRDQGRGKILPLPMLKSCCPSLATPKDKRILVCLGRVLSLSPRLSPWFSERGWDFNLNPGVKMICSQEIIVESSYFHECKVHSSISHAIHVPEVEVSWVPQTCDPQIVLCFYGPVGSVYSIDKGDAEESSLCVQRRPGVNPCEQNINLFHEKANCLPRLKSFMILVKPVQSQKSEFSPGDHIWDGCLLSIKTSPGSIFEDILQSISCDCCSILLDGLMDLLFMLLPFTHSSLSCSLIFKSLFVFELSICVFFF